MTRAGLSGISDDAYWRLYVERMRRQPAGGITLEDKELVLRFLHYFTWRREDEESRGGSSTSHPPVFP